MSMLKLFRRSQAASSRAVLDLSRMAPVDRDWILAQLSAEERARLTALVNPMADALGGRVGEVSSTAPDNARATTGFNHMLQSLEQQSQQASSNLNRSSSQTATAQREVTRSNRSPQTEQRLHLLRALMRRPGTDWLMLRVLAALPSAQTQTDRSHQQMMREIQKRATQADALQTRATQKRVALHAESTLGFQGVGRPPEAALTPLAQRALVAAVDEVAAQHARRALTEVAPTATPVLINRWFTHRRLRALWARLIRHHGSQTSNNAFDQSGLTQSALKKAALDQSTERGLA